MKVCKWLASVGLGVFFLGLLAGCGDTKPKSLAKDIEAIEQTLKTAQTAENNGELDRALRLCKKGSEDALKLQIKAADVELTRIKGLSEDLNQKIVALNLKQDKIRLAAEAAAKQAAAGGTQLLDPAEARRLEEAKQAAEAAKRQQQAEADKARLLVSTKKPQGTESDDVPTAADSATAAGNPAGPGGRNTPGKGTDDALAKAVGALGGAAAKGAGDGLFPVVANNNPPVDIVKLVQRGKFAVAYVQVFNPDEAGRRIMGTATFFKDKDNQTLAKSEAAFLFKNFNISNTNPTNQGANCEAVTMGSHSVDGFAALQLCIPIEHDRAADIRKVSMVVIYDDGSRKTGDGPTRLEAAGKDAPADAPKNDPAARKKAEK